MSTDEGLRQRVYRDRFWRGLTLLVGLVAVAGIAALTARAVRSPGVGSVVAALPVGAALIALTTYMALGWRVHTVVDDTGLTQHWISGQYRIEWPEVTDVEMDQAGGYWARWFIRVYRGEHTFETVPCWWWPWASVPPPTLLVAYRDIRQRWELTTDA